MQPGQPIKYNSTRPAIRMQVYGRMVQDMVDYALTIEDRAERQHYAKAIFNVMLALTTSNVRSTKNHERTTPAAMPLEREALHKKVWDHLAQLSDYRLDIDYPYEVVKHSSQQKPIHLDYPGGNIRYRHYGHLLETAIKATTEITDDNDREAYVRLLANRMKRDLAEWKGSSIDDRKVADDFAAYTEGQVCPDFSARPLPNVRPIALQGQEYAMGKKRKRGN